MRSRARRISQQESSKTAPTPLCTQSSIDVERSSSVDVERSLHLRDVDLHVHWNDGSS